MTTLHILRSNGFSNNKLQQCLATMQNGDILLLIDDGVFNIADHAIAQLSTPVFVLEEHYKARGLSTGAEKMIGYQKMVELTDNARKVITWQ